MKRKRAGRRGWHRVVSDQETVLNLHDGQIVDYLAGEVTRPLEVPCCGQTLKILDTGYRWLHHSPNGKNHALTVQLDRQGLPQQLYVDVGDGVGVDDDGMPYINDLYLDVIALCRVETDGSWRVTATEIIDQHELEEALQAGQVSQAQYKLAWAEARAVEAALKAQNFASLEVLRNYLADPSSDFRH